MSADPRAPKPHDGPQDPSDWVMRFLPSVAAGGTVLDVACGTGRHLAPSLDRGLSAVGIDIDPSGLAPHPRLETIAADLEAGEPWPIGNRRFQGVIVTNYLYRPIFPDIVRAVALDGILIYETFAKGQERHGRPGRQQFMLSANELLVPALDGGLVVIAYEQGELAGGSRAGGRAKIVQRIAAVGPEHRHAFREPLRLVPARA